MNLQPARQSGEQAPISAARVMRRYRLGVYSKARCERSCKLLGADVGRAELADGGTEVGSAVYADGASDGAKVGESESTVGMTDGARVGCSVGVSVGLRAHVVFNPFSVHMPHTRAP